MLETKILALDDAKMTGDGPGRFSGWASTFGNVDSYGDTIVKGAYKGTIPKFLKDGFIPWGHAWDGYPIATPSKAREDDHGLWIEAEFHSDPESQRARQIVAERLERGLSMGLSIGYQARSFDFTEINDQPVRRLTEIDLMEVSLVPMPADDSARVASVKAKRRLSRHQLEAVIATLQALMGDEDEDAVAEALAAEVDDGKAAETPVPAILTLAATGAQIAAELTAFTASLKNASASDRIEARAWAADIAQRMTASRHALDAVLRRADEEAELDISSLFRVADALDVRYGAIEKGVR